MEISLTSSGPGGQCAAERIAHGDVYLRAQQGVAHTVEIDNLWKAERREPRQLTGDSGFRGT